MFMSEKTGGLEKLKYDFDTTNNCEVQLGDTWCRLTPREFRSCNRPRRISYLEEDKYIIKEYLGPIYYFGTNILVENTDKEGLIFIDGVDTRDSSTGKSYGRI